ncbi:50S ribosomal protein L18 [Tepidiforma sp.]|uniref:50S ribosomal protein L18 n=1 Tax=Tepidiforma sp. TaxID=2682230 RepID=UPI002ADD8139|nr:50S ribosomal protein L18 [Tepidiforma sp.]
MSTTTSVEARKRRHLRVRKKISGTPERPRLNVFRSAQHIYAQVIDDTTGHTLAAASDLEPTIAAQAAGKTKTERAALVGAAIAERARARGIERVVFDRGGFLYHGRVRALAEAAREAGLGF